MEKKRVNTSPTKTKNGIPNLKRGVFDVPAEKGSISIFGCDSKPMEGPFEVPGASASPDEAPVPLAKSDVPGFCLQMLLDFSALYPSFSSSASFEDKP